MRYQALLCCPDDKTARVVTQVLSELEFQVECCNEPFAAVKKLMAQHFDAIVVDCENEQNATLVFKSARNSSSNQASLAVAVVEGQAGVAKPFRIVANLVLTKPINVEQAKGTLRVARGLLRKSEAAKADGPAASAPIPRGGNGATPFAAKPAPQTASSHPPARSVSREDDVLGLDVSSAPLDMPANTDDEEAVATPAWPQGMDSKPGSPGFGGGAAIAPAPARVPEIPAITAHGASKKTSEAEPSVEKPAGE